MSTACILEVCLAATFTIVFVLTIHLFSWKCKNRDEPKTICRRAIGACMACLFSTCIVYNLNYEILFAGPILQWILDVSLSRLSEEIISWKHAFTSLCAWRNFVIAPITEEWCFRACTLSVLNNCIAPTASILIGPLFFSLAHFHHVIEMKRCNVPWGSAIFNCTFQACYTYLFGVYASFLYQKTGCLAGVVLCHSFCNLMGFPPFERVAKESKFIVRVSLILFYVSGFLGWLLALRILYT